MTQEKQFYRILHQARWRLRPGPTLGFTERHYVDLLVSDFAFDQLQLHRIHGPVMADNEAVIQTRLYLGYVQEGIAREHYIYNGEFKDAVMFGLLEDEYRRTCRPRLESLIRLFGSVEKG